MKRVNFNDLHKQLIEEKEGFLEDLSDSIQTTDFILGGSVAEFESMWSQITQNVSTVAVANGSDALRITLRALGISRGDVVAIVGNTYFAAAAAIMHVGARPAFFDVCEDTRFPSEENFESIIDLNPDAVIRSHLYGYADIANIPNSLKEIPVIHDCSQAHGTYVNGQHIGSMGLSTYSFYPGKNLGALGDAGAISTGDNELVPTLRKLRNQGTNQDKYFHETDGYNSRMDTIQAKFLLRRLKTFEVNNEKRRNIALQYDEAFSNMERVDTFPVPSNVVSSYHLYQIRIKGCTANEIQTYLRSQGIETGRHYPISLDEQPAFKDYAQKTSNMAISHRLAKELISLPLHPHLTSAEVGYVAAKIGEFLGIRE